MRFIKVIWFAYKEKRKAYLLTRIERLTEDTEWYQSLLGETRKPTGFTDGDIKLVKRICYTVGEGVKLRKKIVKIRATIR